jgi:hypothetical protein
MMAAFAMPLNAAMDESTNEQRPRQLNRFPARANDDSCESAAQRRSWFHSSFGKTSCLFTAINRGYWCGGLRVIAFFD